MRVFPEFGSNAVSNIGDYMPGVCEGNVSRRDGHEVVTTVIPWLQGRAMEEVTVVTRPHGVLHVQTDSRDAEGGLVRGVTIYDPAHRPENPAEAARFDAAMGALVRAATHSRGFVPASAVETSQKRSA